MSYNNLGLDTAKGSGTSGYVTRNLSTLPSRGRMVYTPVERKERVVDSGILDHFKRREVEVLIAELREELEEDGVEEDEVERRVEVYRERVRRRGIVRREEGVYPSKEKEEEVERMRKALGISAEYHRGDAFASGDEAEEEDDVPVLRSSWLDRAERSSRDDGVSGGRSYRESRSHRRRSRSSEHRRRRY